MAPVIGIIGGNGWLGRALARPALEKSVITQDRLIISCRAGVTNVYDNWPSVRIMADNQGLVEASDLIIVSVRPEQFDDIAISAHGKPVISLMAGRSSDIVAKRTGSDRIIRAMPNAAAEIGLSFTPWCASSTVTETDKAWAQEFLAASGIERQVAGEREIDYFTGLTGSGPAFPALVAKAMIEHAQSRGIPEATAKLAVSTLFAGAVKLMDGVDLSSLIAAFMDYRGTTAAGLQAMETHGLGDAIKAGLDAADAKARAMSGD